MLRELEYPFDAESILTKKKSIKKTLLADGSKRTGKKIAILGGFTTAAIRQVMELFLLNQGIEPSFYESEYDQYYQDAVFDNPELAVFAPDVIYVCTSNRNITTYPAMRDSAAYVDTLLDNEMHKFTSVWDNLTSRYRCPIIQNNFEMPFYRLMGNKDASDIHGKVNFLTRLNLKFYEYAQTHENFYICDLNYISADYGLKKWSDPFYYHMYKYALNINAVPYLSFNVSNIIKSLFGKNKKGFVLDLDNTLWGGVIGDDGVDNIVIGPEESEGQVYSEFQRYLKEHKDLGVILNVDSKNDESNALAGLKHPDSELAPDDFIMIKANWDPKDKNFSEIASSLNLLPESLLFVDDNPAERHIVREQLPGVVAPEIGEVHEYIQNIDRGGYFEVTTLSADDAKRNDMYKENAARAQLEASFTDYRDYLLSLEMKGIIRPFEPAYMARIAQLTNKSNQFNLTTKRYTQAEIEEAAADPSYITLYGKLTDRFGDNGVVSVVIGHLAGGECLIDLWLMSCRVLKRDMEFAMMDTLVKRCLAKGVNKIRGFYYPTAKNAMVRDFYGLQGFTKISEDADGNTVWELDLKEDYTQKNTVITVEE
ncbi:MAG: HAD-IIIC family phosphatase [Lachnospiraceae bacterium]|nr:HAD-IIIC family phosphatase [Lachnospiraceae bacterium]